MTRKDYVLIASAFSEARDQAKSKDAHQALSQVTHALAGDLKRDNPRFDVQHFLRAAGE